MRAQIFSDLHGDVHALERLIAVEADYYFAAGDLVTWARGLDRAGAVLKTRGSRVHVIPGNHESAADIERLCETYGLTNFHGGTLTAGHARIAALGYSSPTPFDTPGEYSESELATRLDAFTAFAPNVLICHAPPRDTALDRIRNGLHAGSSAVAEFIERTQPAWFFCGHIHEAEGVEIPIGATRAINVGKRGYLLEWDQIPL